MAIIDIYELAVYVSEYLSVNDIISGIKAGFLPPTLENDINFFSTRAYQHYRFPKEHFNIESVSAIERYRKLELLCSNPFMSMRYSIKEGHIRDAIDLSWVSTIDEINDFVSIACKYGQFDIFDHFMSLGADPFKHGMEAFHLACQYGHGAIVKYFVLLGADPFHQYTSPFEMACRHGHLNIVKFFSSLPHFIEADVSTDGLMEAYIGDNVDIVDYLFSNADLYSIELTRWNNSLLKHAIEKGDTDFIERLLARPEVLASNLDNAFDEACGQGNIDLVKRLIDRVNIINSPILAVINGHLDIFELLIEYAGLDVAAGDNFYLVNSLKYEQFHIADRLLEYEEVLLDKSGDALRAAIRYKLINYTKVLFEAYADRMNQRNLVKRHRLGLLTAVQTSWTEGVKYLIGDVRVKYGLTPSRNTYLKQAKTEEIRALLSTT